MTRTVDPFDELAALFLTETEEKTGGGGGSGPGAPPAPTTEIAIIGHLPVRAGFWLAPYAAHLAQEAGPTALLRLDRDEPLLDVLHGPDDDGPDQTTSTLREAIAQVAGVARTWVIRPSVQTSMTEVIEAEVDRITILSSADEAAVVRAYQVVKDLVESCERAGRRRPVLGLAVLGAEPDAAQRVLDRLNRTTDSFLGVQVPLVACLPQMDATLRSTWYRRFEDEACPSTRQALKWVRKGIEASRAIAEPRPKKKPPAVAPAPTPALASPYDIVASSQSAHAEAESVEPPVIEIRREAAFEPRRPTERWGREEPEASQATRQAGPIMPPPAPRPVHARPPIKLAPKPAVEVEPKAEQPAREPSAGAQLPNLCDYIDGVTLLPVRCPGHERIEIGVDRAGRLHLAAREDALRELRFVETWALAHREILTMACCDHYIDPAGRRVSHVFTDRPASLADLHHSGLRLHVLTPVRMGDHTAWYAAPLNAAVV